MRDETRRARAAELARAREEALQAKVRQQKALMEEGSGLEEEEEEEERSQRGAHATQIRT